MDAHAKLMEIVDDAGTEPLAIYRGVAAPPDPDWLAARRLAASVPALVEALEQFDDAFDARHDLDPGDPEGLRLRQDFDVLHRESLIRIRAAHDKAMAALAAVREEVPGEVENAS